MEGLSAVLLCGRNIITYSYFLKLDFVIKVFAFH